MTWQPMVVFVLPLVVAVVLWLWGPRASVRRAWAIATGLALTGISAGMVVAAHEGAVGVIAFGNWAPPFGVAFVVDRLSALMVLLVSVLLTVTVVAHRPSAHGDSTVGRAVPLLLLLAFGLHGAFMTGDLFNLFVMFEVVLIASYLLLQIPGTGRSARAAFTTIVVNLLASMLFFAGVGTLYGAVGSVNLADLAARIDQVPVDLRLAALSMLVVAFGTKAALVPVAFWMPGTYPVTSGPIAAFFAGVMAKLGAYALIRIAPLLLDGTVIPSVLVWVGAVSALAGVLAALAQYEVRRLLAFHSVSQMGYVVTSFALLTVGGMAAALYFLVHHALVKSSLVLVADELERRHGHRDLRHMPAARLEGGAWLGGLFFASAITLAGLPPTSGFVAKVAVFAAGLDAGAYVPLAALVVASLFTLASMIKIWQHAFQTDPAAPASRSIRSAPRAGGKLVPLASLVGGTLLIALGAGPTLAYTQATARQLLDVRAYVDVVRAIPGHGSERGGVP
jgi:multicomponent Na+:H+ antiporter subunit D